MEQDQNKPLTQSTHMTQWDYQYDQNIDDMHRKDAFSVIFSKRHCAVVKHNVCLNYSFGTRK